MSYCRQRKLRYIAWSYIRFTQGKMWGKIGSKNALSAID